MRSKSSQRCRRLSTEPKQDHTVDQDDPDTAARAELLDRFPTIRKAVAPLAEGVPFGAAEGGGEVLAEFQRLPQLFSRTRCRKLTTAQISAELVGSSWRRLVLGHLDLAADQVDQRAYVSAIAEAFHSRLRRGDVFACGGLRWSDPRAKLLDAQQWQAAKPDVLTPGTVRGAPAALAELTGKLDTAYRVVADRVHEGADQPATVGADGRLHLDKLEPQEASDEQTELSRVCAAMLPQVDLPDLIMEVHGWTGCLDEYTHLSEADARMSELPLSVAACLVA